eukprot:10591274-Ditylum_brightwellii.AAC.1
MGTSTLTPYAVDNNIEVDIDVDISIGMGTILHSDESDDEFVEVLETRFVAGVTGAYISMS